MKKTIALVFMLALSFFALHQPGTASATAANCNCKLHCGDGSWYQISASDGTACQAAFDLLCSGWGDFSYTSNPNGFPGCPIPVGNPAS